LGHRKREKKKRGKMVKKKEGDGEALGVISHSPGNYLQVGKLKGKRERGGEKEVSSGGKEEERKAIPTRSFHLFEGSTTRKREKRGRKKKKEGHREGRGRE